jgi:CPA2 family monovalent cation:H+ antiporter-2
VADPQIFLDLVLAVAAAFVGGVLAQRAGLPVVVGYLLAGLAIGPFTPGPSIGTHSISALADVGVALLMFAVGCEFSRAELRRLGRVALMGGIAATMALGIGVGWVLGFPSAEAVFLGALISLSSTVVALKMLMSRGELDSLHGRVSLGILLVQDLVVVPMAVLLPTLGRGAGLGLTRLLMQVAEAAALMIGTYLLGIRIVPWVLGHVAVPRTRELFLLGVVSLALGTALIAQAIGPSLAFGAFLAGLVVAESEYRTQVVAEVLPSGTCSRPSSWCPSACSSTPSTWLDTRVRSRSSL